jgi:DNA helicase-2/ATP-dependent DNA helicase PcrA
MQKHLTREQLSVIHNESPHLAVIAVPGAGKTTTLLQRARHLSAKGRVVVVTFTREAAGELIGRLRKDELTKIMCSTIHALAYHIIKENYKQLGYEKPPEVADQPLQEHAERQVGKLIMPKAKVETIHSAIDTARRKYIRSGKMDRLLSTYHATLARAHLVGSDDLIPLAYCLLASGQAKLPQDLENMTALLVDEWQDCSEAEVSFVWELSRQTGAQVTVIGDPNQAIYGWRTGYYDAFANLDARFSKAYLTLNHRSCATICEKAEALAKLITPVPIIPALSCRGAVDLIRPFDAAEEATLVSQFVRQSRGTVAVLARTNAYLTEFLSKSSIKYKRLGDSSLLDNKAATLLKALGQVLQGKTALRPAILLEAVPPDVLNAIVAGNGHDEERLLEVISKSGLLEVVEMGKRGCSAREVVLAYVSNKLAKRLGVASVKDYLLGLAAEVETFDQFMKYLNRHQKITGKPTERLVAGTIHSAKGLEFDTVVLVGFVEGVLPVTHDKADIGEERRICFVGITRARTQLLLSAPRYRTSGKRVIPAQVSRFASEMHLESTNKLPSAIRLREPIKGKKRQVKGHLFNKMYSIY